MAKHPWDVFATLTWAEATGPEKVRRDFWTWLNRWSGDTAVRLGLGVWIERNGRRFLKGWWRNQTGKGHHRVEWVLGVEPHRTGRLHAHALVKFPACLGSPDRSYGWDLWKQWHGLARIEPPRGAEDVAAYVSKYVVKTGSELNISESYQLAVLFAGYRRKD